MNIRTTKQESFNSGSIHDSEMFSIERGNAYRDAIERLRVRWEEFGAKWEKARLLRNKKNESSKVKVEL